ncbi:MAG: hypothetical protein OXR62_03530 [Ahrensia sp.]|nr:hypothetical protein [Ahrensia sp.]
MNGQLVGPFHVAPRDSDIVEQIVVQQEQLPKCQTVYLRLTIAAASNKELAKDLAQLVYDAKCEKKNAW